MKKTIVWVIVIAIIAAAIIGIANKSKSHTSLKEPLTIGYIGPLSGPSAVLGMDAVKAIQIAVDETNATGGIEGHSVTFVFQDDQYLTKSTISAYRKMVDTDGAKIVFVANYGGVIALKDMAKKDGVIIIDPLDCNADTADASKNTFCIATETESIGQSLANYLIEQGRLSTGIMYSTKDQFMVLVANAFRAVYESAGGKVVVESFNYDDADFKTQLTKIKATNPMALLLLGHDETGSIMKQARDLGIKAPFLTTGTITSPGAQALAKGRAEGTVFAFWDADAANVAATQFTEKFTQLVGRPPILPLTTHPAYDAAKIALSLSSYADAGEIRSALFRVNDYKGTTGIVTMQNNGAAPIKESVFRLEKGVPVKI